MAKREKPRPIFFFIFLCMFVCNVGKAYVVKGSLKHLNCFYPKVYLSVIDNIDGLYAVSYQDIISTASVDTAGNFSITGNDLPDEPRFYRLYVTNNELTKSSLYTGKIRNYILLTLDNKTEVEIDCENFCAPFFSYTIRNSPANAAMLALQSLLTTHDSLKRGAPGASKEQFLEKKLHSDLMHFADTCKYPMAGLWAVVEAGIDSSFNTDASFLYSFAAKFKKESLTPAYSQQLDEKLGLLQYKKEAGSFHISIAIFIMVCLLFACSLILNIYLVLKRGSAKMDRTPSVNNVTEEDRIKKSIETLTIKEREILQMIHEGLSNKEIAAKLHVEVSTVKTHVSSIYQKTAIANRKEVAGIARYL